MTFEAPMPGYFEIGDLNGDWPVGYYLESEERPAHFYFPVAITTERQSMTESAPALALEKFPSALENFLAVNELSLEIKPGIMAVFLDRTARAKAPRST